MHTYPISIYCAIYCNQHSVGTVNGNTKSEKWETAYNNKWLTITTTFIILLHITILPRCCKYTKADIWVILIWCILYRFPCYWFQSRLNKYCLIQPTKRKSEREACVWADSCKIVPFRHTKVKAKIILDSTLLVFCICSIIYVSFSISSTRYENGLRT